MTRKESYYTTAEAARLLGFSVEYTRHLIREGQLGATKLKGYKISKKDLESFKKSRRSRPLYE